MKTKRCTNWQWLIAYAAILMLAYSARALQIAYADLTFDEVATVFVALRSPLEVIQYLINASREHPPLYYLGMSLWLKVAGTSELAVRYPSVLVGVLTAGWGIHAGRRLCSKEGGLWAGLLLAILPFSVWAGRNGRMYSLVILLALINLDLFRLLVQKPNWRVGAGFLVVTLLGAFTHYYLLLLWPAQGLLLLLLPKKTRRLRRFWLIATFSAAMLLAIFLLVSSGTRTTFLEVANRFPTRNLRLRELKYALMDIYLYWHHTTLNEEFWIAIGLTVLGWILAWRHDIVTGTLLAVTCTIPVLITHFIPAAIEARYLALIVPGLVLSLTVLMTHFRPHWLRAAVILLILLQINTRWERLRFPPDTTFSDRMARLHQVSRPGDALIMNGPWSALLLTYYEPPENLTVYRVPEAAPPGFDAEVDIPRLEEIAAEHERIWVSYGAVSETDPTFGVSHWLAKEMYCVERYQNLALYLPPPKRMTQISDRMPLADQLQIRQVKINKRTFTPSEFLVIGMAWEGSELSWRIHPTLALRDDQGNVWVEESFNLGPEQSDESINLDSPWTTQRGLRIPPGTPPGRYTLSLRVESKGFTLSNGDQLSRWIYLTELLISRREVTKPTAISGKHQVYLPMVMKNRTQAQAEAIMQPGLYAIPNPHRLSADFEGRLELLGYQIEQEVVDQGYPLKLALWWKTNVAAPQAQFNLRLSHKDAPTQSYELGPSFYPTVEWRTGDVVKQMISYPISRSLPPGIYQVEIQLVNGQAEPLAISGSRDALTVIERIQNQRHSLDGTWGSIDTVRIQKAARKYHAPFFRHRVNAKLGDVLRLRGYRIESNEIQAGETVELTEYWEAQRSPDRIYALFNHLKAEDGTLIWQEDSWPQSGTYTTNFWVAGEVVAESYTIQIPPDTPAGEYTLYVGAYDPKNANVRLPAVNAQGERLLHDQVPLLTLKVTP
jgi:hypothetical protein